MTPPPLATTQVAVAVGVMLAYIATLWVMFNYRDDKQWDRMVFLFSGFEAIVFVAVGAIFGTRIQRASVEAASESSRQAREDLRTERDRADFGYQMEDAYDALVAVLKRSELTRSTSNGASNETPPAANDYDDDGGLVGSRGGDKSGASQETGAADLAYLIKLADDLRPRRRGRSA